MMMMMMMGSGGWWWVVDVEILVVEKIYGRMWGRNDGRGGGEEVLVVKSLSFRPEHFTQDSQHTHEQPV